jgi:tetratricopeptide (TPR) repeat protein
MPGKRVTRPRKSRSQRRSSRRPAPTPDYEDDIRRADEILSENDLEPRDDNWKALVIEVVADSSPERSQLSAYILEHENTLGATWAREVLRLEVFLRAQAHEQIIAHYDYALSRYPRCAVVDLWVASYIFRHQGDFWRARSMYRYVQEKIPQHPRTYYEIGFMHHLLGDLPGALREFNRAAERMSGYGDELAARVLYNRAVIRYALEGEKDDAIADLERALEHQPDYHPAQAMLRDLQGRWWLPW